MNFLVVLTAWALLQWRGPATPLHRDHWFHFWFLRAGAALAALPAALRLALTALLPALLAGLVAAVLDPLLAGLPLFLFSLAVLAFSLGRGDYRGRVEAYLQRWERGDHAAAFEEAVALGLIAPAAEVSDAAALHRSVRRALLYQGYERWFGAVFWFALLGPAGALGYRTLHLLRADPHASAAERDRLATWLHWADWVPVRLLGLTFAVVGSFGDCFRHWCDSWWSSRAAPEQLELFEQAALGAAGANDELRQLLTLLSRSAVGWLIALAILQLV